jgi:hypothetical protein
VDYLAVADELLKRLGQDKPRKRVSELLRAAQPAQASA